jgi:hypothetical protein
MESLIETKEKIFVEKELNLLVEITLKLENELDRIVNYKN